jgi:hypothetical protein
MNDKLKPVLAVIATVGVIVFNWLAATGYLGGIDPGAISAKYPTRITPAGYAFAIWSLIYFGLLIFSIYQFLPKNRERFRSIRTVYILSCAANCAWLYFWHHEMILFSLAVIFVLLASLAFINIKLKTAETYGEYWLANAPFGLYFGWVTVATILNAAVALVYLNVRVSDSTANLSGAALILIAAFLGVLIRVQLRNYFYPLAIAWALTAIAVKQSGQTLIVAAAAVGVIACLIAAISFVMHMKSSNFTSDLK